MKILFAYPPNIKEIEEKFDLSGKKPVFAYGKVLFNPHRSLVDEYLLCHELTHATQQGNDPKSWWDRYLSDSSFRLEQEVEAYHAQYSMAARVSKDRNKTAKYLHRLAIELSGALYGNIIGFTRAYNLIKYGNSKIS